MGFQHLVGATIVAVALSACAEKKAPPPPPAPEPTGVRTSYKTFDILSADGQEAVGALQRDGRIVLRGFNFETDSAELNDEAKAALGRLGPALTNFPGVTTNIAIVGHTDNTGDHDYNMSLSERRAESIMKVMIEDYGVAKERLVAVGMGPLAPIDKNATEEGRAQNRRVELWAVN